MSGPLVCKFEVGGSNGHRRKTTVCNLISGQSSIRQVSSLDVCKSASHESRSDSCFVLHSVRVYGQQLEQYAATVMYIGQKFAVPFEPTPLVRTYVDVATHMIPVVQLKGQLQPCMPECVACPCIACRKPRTAPKLIGGETRLEIILPSLMLFKQGSKLAWMRLRSTCRSRVRCTP